MNYKIIASDLDGTLLNGQGRISDENWKAIEELGKKGVHFVPASGRAFEEMPPELRESPLLRYYITSDGTTVYDKETDTTHEMPLPSGEELWVRCEKTADGVKTVYRAPQGICVTVI